MSSLFVFLIILSPFHLVASLDIRLAVFFSKNPGISSNWGYGRTAAALSFALDQLRNDSVIQDDVNITFIKVFYPMKDDGYGYSIGKMSDVWLEEYDAVIGLAHSAIAKSALLVASYFNIPVISWGATDATLRHKKVYTTLIRVMGDFEQFSSTISQLFKLYHWTTCAVYYQESFSCAYAMNSFLKTGVIEYGIKVSENIHFDSSTALTDDDIDQTLLRIKQRARVILVCGSQSDNRRIMIRAHANGMTNGEYKFITYGSLADSAPDRPWFLKGDDENNAVAKEAYKYVFHVSWAKGDDARHSQFTQKMLSEQLPDRMAQPPWNFEQTREQNLTGSYIANYVYDCMYTYGLLLNKSLEKKLDYRNGELMFNLSKELQFDGITGLVWIDDVGDRQPDYWVWDYNKTTGVKYLAMHISTLQNGSVKMLAPIHWQTKDGKPPPDLPPCGFMNELCPPDDSVRNSIIIGLVVSVLIVSCGAGLGFYQYRKKKQEEEMARMLWRVDFSEVRFSKFKRGLGSQASFVSMVSASRGSLNKDENSGQLEGQLFALIAQYRNLIVCVRSIHKESIILQREDFVELSKMKGLSHENVNPFVGACIDHPNYCVLFMYCSKGSLMDIVENDDIKLDEMFKASLIQDLTNGLHFLHTSFLKSHGHLKSSNCVIDSRWVLRITDYGLNNMKANQNEDVGEYEKYRRLWWTAPELLREADVPLNGTPRGDIYSYAIILYEIIFRTLPYSTDNLSPKEIVEKIRHGETTPFRPQVLDGEVGPHRQLIWLMKQGWQENPDNRPDMNWVKKKLKTINKGKNLNIVDHMVNMMERYTNNLEDLVEQRTGQLIQEKKKTDTLLYSMMPPVVADRLKTGEVAPPELFESATVFFSDIIGFTTISILSTPIEIIDFLNDVYTLFDGIIKKFDVYKVETISDSYLVVGGIPKRIKHHAGEIADLALTLLSTVLKTPIRHLPQVQTQVRIGLHCGPCCAGVVGLSMPRYCLFGDTVNTASRMETNGLGLRIHLSTQAHQALASLGGYVIEKRGEMKIKGKGIQTTYWLLGKEGFTKSLPTEKDLQPEYDKNGLPVRTW